MYKITLFKQNGSWMARSTNPRVKELFGTDTIPTAFTDAAPHAEVIARIRELNPSYQVVSLDA